MGNPNVSSTSTQEGVTDPVGPASDPGAGIDAPLIEVFGLLLEAHARLVSRLDQDLIDGCGMTLQSFEVLIRLARTPGSSLTAGELARAVALSSGGATRLTSSSTGLPVS